MRRRALSCVALRFRMIQVWKCGGMHIEGRRKLYFKPRSRHSTTNACSDTHYKDLFSETCKHNSQLPSSEVPRCVALIYLGFISRAMPPIINCLLPEETDRERGKERNNWSCTQFRNHFLPLKVCCNLRNSAFRSCCDLFRETWDIPDKPKKKKVLLGKCFDVVTVFRLKRDIGYSLVHLCHYSFRHKYQSSEWLLNWFCRLQNLVSDLHMDLFPAYK
jgi:hypothetical protein